MIRNIFVPESHHRFVKAGGMLPEPVLSHLWLLRYTVEPDDLVSPCVPVPGF